MTTLLLHQFEHWAAATPEACAVRCGPVELSFAELNRRADRVASHLTDLGTQGALIGLCAPPSVDFVIGMLGVLKAGGAWVALDPAYPGERLRLIAEEAGLQTILAGPGQQVAAANLLSPLLSPGLNQVLDISELASSDAAAAVDAQVLPDDLCYIMFTSGSTGVPNGVLVTHANIAGLFSALQTELGLCQDDRWSSLHSFAFGFSVWELWGPLSTGGCLEIVPSDQRDDPALWFPAILERGVTVLSITPSGFRQLLAAECLPDHFDKLRLIVFSGETVHTDDIDAWFRRFGNRGPRLINTYALTETAGRITSHEYVPGGMTTAGTIGRPTADAEVFLLDDQGIPVADGDPGELYIGGPMIARGYLGNDALTAERFVVRDPGDGIPRSLYRTGDHARRTESSELVFVGRGDDQVKLRGHRIDLADIEHALRLHPGVADAAVVLQEDGAAARLVAFVAPRAETELPAESGVEFWPSLGEYQIYDELLYDFMSADELRVASYQRAFGRQVHDKVVLDIGTGKDAILARLCAAAGARKVYAVEVLEAAYEHARHLVNELGLDDRIEVLHGDMQDTAVHDVIRESIDQPIDVCTQGIVGNIGSSDGIVPIWNSARSIFANDFRAVPSACSTYFAPAELPEAARESSAFSPLAARYTREIFEREGREFDVRLCVRNFPVDNALAESAVFEHLEFSGELSAEYEQDAVFIVSKEGRFDGFLLWTNIRTDEHESVDFLEHQQAWLPVWFPVADEPVGVSEGDRINVHWRCTTPAGQIFPDYSCEVEVLAANGTRHSFNYTTRHFEKARGSTGLHRSLLASLNNAEDNAEDNAEESIENQTIQDWLRGQLPDYMVPAHWVTLQSLPLNSNGKLDRQSLLNYESNYETGEAETDEVDSDFADEFEQAIAGIWRDVLGNESLGLQQDFFDAGGDSILAVRLTTEVQRYLDDTVFLAALFDAPTVRAYTDWLREHHTEAVARRCGETARPLVESRSALPQLTAVSRGEPVELSWPQQSLWFLQQLYPGSTGANEQFLIRVSGQVNVDRLRSAWHEVLRRHDALRTCFTPGGPDGRVAQQVVPLEVCVAAEPAAAISLADLGKESAWQRLREIAEQDLAIPFDLQNAPLLRTHIYVLRDEVVLMVTAHHIVADGMCVQLIRDELAQAYSQAYSLDAKKPRPELQYEDFSRWQRQVLSDDFIAADLRWWQETLAGHDGQPSSRILTNDGGGSEARYSFEIGAMLADDLRRLARTAGATPFMVLLAAWRVWLARCLMEKDLLLGSPVTLRTDAETAGMLGCMVNNVVFRNELNMATNFTDILNAEKETVIAALGHSSAPFEKVVEVVQPERQFGRHPLFQLLFLYEDRSASAVEVDGARFMADVLPVDRSSYWDLELSITDCGEHLAMHGFIGVRRDIYDADALSWWTEGFVAMLTAIVREPQAIVADLPLLSPAQRHRILVEWNDTSLPVAPETTLHGLVAAQASRTPDRIAVRDEHEQLTYSELMQRADHYAAAFAEQGAGPGDLIGLCAPRSAELIALQIAVLRCGAAWLPLDPGYPEARLTLMAEDASPVLIVCADEGAFPQAENRIGLAELKALSMNSETDKRALSFEPAPGCGEDIAYALYTSGSTGTPKGVLATHASAVSRCRWMWREYNFAEEDVFAQRTSPNFIDSVWEIFGALAHGACVNVLSPLQEHDPVAIADWLEAEGITHLVVVPTLLRALLETYESQPVPDQLHTVISSGETLTPALAGEFHRVFPGRRLLNTYGTSETWDVSCYEVGAEDGAASKIPIGRPVANAALCILDEAMQPLPPGVEGELFAGGAGLAREYLQRPDMTREQFIANPLPEVDTSRLYRTGDIARFRDDGTVELVGRRDRQIKLRGLRIEISEIESQVLAVDGVAECAVVLQQQSGMPDWLSLYIVPAEHCHPDSDDIRRYLQSRLPRGMVPADICLIEEFPLTPSGKIDLLALPVSDPANLGAQHYVAPRGPVEETLARIWADALGLDTVGAHDNFFALRGHSLLATRVIARIGEELGLDLPLQCIFEAPTVAGLARSIDALRWAAHSMDASAGGESGREVIRL